MLEERKLSHLTIQLPWTANVRLELADFETRACRQFAAVLDRMIETEHPEHASLAPEQTRGLLEDAIAQRLKRHVGRIVDRYVNAFDRIASEELGIRLGLRSDESRIRSDDGYPKKIFARVRVTAMEYIRVISWDAKRHRLWRDELLSAGRDAEYQRMIGSLISDWTSAQRGLILRSVIDVASVEERALKLIQTGDLVTSEVDWCAYRKMSIAMGRTTFDHEGRSSPGKSF